MNQTEQLIKRALEQEITQPEVLDKHFVIYEQDVNLQYMLRAITSAWIKKHYGNEWTVIQLDNISFLEATTAKSRATIQNARLGIAHDKDLNGYREKIKEAKNTLAIIMWDWQSDKDVVDALRSSVDTSVAVIPASETLTRAIDWPHGVITPTL